MQMLLNYRKYIKDYICYIITLCKMYVNTNKHIYNTFKERVREENLRSLKVLNSYLDSLSQNSGVYN